LGSGLREGSPPSNWLRSYLCAGLPQRLHRLRGSWHRGRPGSCCWLRIEAQSVALAVVRWQQGPRKAAWVGLAQGLAWCPAQGLHVAQAEGRKWSIVKAPLGRWQRVGAPAFVGTGRCWGSGDTGREEGASRYEACEPYTRVGRISSRAKAVNYIPLSWLPSIYRPVRRKQSASDR
jgi:hypothetical protein